MLSVYALHCAVVQRRNPSGCMQERWPRPTTVVSVAKLTKLPTSPGSTAGALSIGTFMRYLAMLTTVVSPTTNDVAPRPQYCTSKPTHAKCSKPTPPLQASQPHNILEWRVWLCKHCETEHQPDATRGDVDGLSSWVEGLQKWMPWPSDDLFLNPVHPGGHITTAQHPCTQSSTLPCHPTHV
jgi:hypothetical protein